jgi:molecular chaperone GrpE (heat shock protein)
MTRFILAVLSAANAAAAGAARESATPISKVLDMLHELSAKGDKEMKDEATRFSAFSQWCEDTDRVRSNEIAEAEALMEELEAQILDHKAHIKELTDRIEELEEDVGRWKKDSKSITDVREMEKSDYDKTLQDYMESLDALDGAIAVLKKRSANVAQPESETWQGAALLELRRVQALKLTPAPTKRAVASFIQLLQPDVEAMPSDELLKSAPEAYAYEFQSGGVVDMLEKLKKEFSDNKYEMEMEEKKAQHAFEQMFQHLADNIENAEHEISKKTETRAQTQEALAEAQAELAETTAQRDEDKRYLMETQALCKVKAADFEARQKLRQEELDALAKATEIISSETVKGSGEKHLPQLLQLGASKASALAMVRRTTDASPQQQRLIAFLTARAKATGSKVLAMVAERAAADPFVKVKKMIKDLIVKLMEEATAETEHKGWCDAELTTNKQTREARTEDVNKLTALIEELNAEIADLTQRVEELTKAVAELEKEMAQATEDRAASKATNEATIADAKAAQTAVENAIAVLKDFYAKSAEATAFAQSQPDRESTAWVKDEATAKPSEDAPETFDKPYKGMLPEGGSVVDFLEVILTDFSRLEAETASSEAAELAEYKKYMHESELDKALKENEIKHKSARIEAQTSALHEAEENLQVNQERLDAAVAYYEKLKPECVDSGITYEQRVKNREAEIQSLEEALKILTGVEWQPAEGPTA